MQWSADITKHAHIDEIKVPAHASNNQNYYSQISRHLGWLEKCFRFDLATYIEEHLDKGRDDDEDFSNSGKDEDHEPDAEKIQFADYSTPTRRIPNYFSISASLLLRTKPSAPKPYCTFATSTTGFHLAAKPLSRLTIDEAANTHQLPDLGGAIVVFFANEDPHFQVLDKLQVWHKVRIQQLSYHNEILLPPQTLCAIPPSTTNPYGRYDSAIISLHPQSDWPKNGLVGHSVSQVQMVFCLLRSDLFFVYVQHFDIVCQPHPTNVSPVTGMHMLKWAVRGNGQCIGEVIPLVRIHSPAHLVPNFGREAHSRLMSLSSYELSNEFWLNRYWSKEFYYALSSA